LTNILSFQYGQGAASKKLRTVCSSLGCQVVKSGHEVVIQLNQHFPSTH